MEHCMCGMCDFRSIHSIGSENSLQIQIVDNFFLLSTAESYSKHNQKL